MTALASYDIGSYEAVVASLGAAQTSLVDAPSLAWHDVALRLGAAAAFGGVLGAERELRGRDAGLRTHMLLSLGSALFATASVGAFGAYEGLRSETNVNIDVTRIAAYVAPGVGFIGAGVIVKHVTDSGRSSVRGLTTAASLWAAAAVGVASGLGFWSGAVAAVVLALVALAVVRPLSGWIERRAETRPRQAVVTITVAERDVVGRVLEVLVSGHRTSDVRVQRAADAPPGGRHEVRVVARLARGAGPHDVVSAVLAVPGVVDVDVVPGTGDAD
jgi:putative Mg2+ transporter-C (MgtC) family protein